MAPRKKFSDPLIEPIDPRPLPYYPLLNAYGRELLLRRAIKEQNPREIRLYQPLPGQKRPTKEQMDVWQAIKGSHSSDWEPGEREAQEAYIAYLNTHNGQPPPPTPKKMGRPAATEPLNARIQINLTVRQAAAIAVLAAAEGLTTPAWVVTLIKAAMETRGQWPPPLDRVTPPAP